MFKQSKLIAQQNWTRFLKRNERERNEFNVHYDSRSLPYRVTLKKPHDQTIHDLMFEMHSLRMHNDLWRAAEHDPLGTLYSAAWTLCSSLAPPQELITNPTRENIPYAEYYANWYPFVLLHRYAIKLRERVSNNSNTSKNITKNSNNVERKNDDEMELFTIEQLIEVDRRYIQSFDELKNVRNDTKLLRRLYVSRENEYLASETFRRMALGTPFGCVERVNSTEIVYTSNLLDVRRKKRLTNLFKRNESYDRLRDQCESKLQKLFPSYVTMKNEPLRLNCWLLSMLRRDEDTNDFDEHYNEDSGYERGYDDDNDNNHSNNNNNNNGNSSNDSTYDPSREYVVYWQYQKSELVWFLLHGLFSLNDSIRDDRLNRDLLYYVANHLERLIECGVCSEHWKRHGSKIWKMYDERYCFAENEWRKRARSMVEGNTQLENMWKVLSYARVQPQIDPTLPQPDQYMLHTHNTVQGDNVSSRKRLTRTCVESLRSDYALYALLIEAAIGDREHATTINRLSMQRDDVLTSESDIYLENMIHEYTMNPTSATTRTSSPVTLRKCDLTLERRSIMNTIHGRRV